MVEKKLLGGLISYKAGDHNIEVGQNSKGVWRCNKLVMYSEHPKQCWMDEMLPLIKIIDNNLLELNNGNKTE